MLKKKNRLLSLKKTGKSQSFDTTLFKIKIFSNGGDVSKFTFIVSKKVDKRAVVRNTTKRVLRKTTKRILDSINQGQDIIIMAKKSMEFKQEEIILQLLIQTFKKAGLSK